LEFLGYDNREKWFLLMNKERKASVARRSLGVYISAAITALSTRIFGELTMWPSCCPHLGLENRGSC